MEDICDKLNAFLAEASNKFANQDIDSEKDMKYVLDVTVHDLVEKIDLIQKETLGDPTVTFAVAMFKKNAEIKAVLSALENIKKLAVKIQAK